MATPILIKKIIIEGEILTLSGLHIGGTEAGMEIGGVNKYVVRNPSDNKPYIPGSSLKGKMRALIELVEGKIGIAKMGIVENGPCMDIQSRGARLFGNIGDKDNPNQRPSRIIVRDAMLLNETNFKGADLHFAQAKTEVVLDRLTAKAMPRTNERVPEGARFKLRMVLNIFEGDDESELLNLVFQGLLLVQDDCLGGNGSRGYGEVKFSISALRERSAAFYLEGKPETDLLISAKLPAQLLPA